MTRDEFCEAARQAHISDAAFSLQGGGDECYVLAEEAGVWCVFYSERGTETQKKYFLSESEALTHLLSLLLADTSTRTGA